jgi:hypothetical protein
MRCDFAGTAARFFVKTAYTKRFGWQGTTEKGYEQDADNDVSDMVDW